MNKPTIEVSSDYEGFFESLVQKWIDEKEKEGTPFKSSSIVITAGPYRNNAVAAWFDEHDENKTRLHLDFYSALRRGFGGLSSSDVQAIKDEWL